MAEENDDLPGDNAPEPKRPAAAQRKPAAVVVEEEEEDRKPAPKRHTHTTRAVDAALALGFSQSDLDNTPPAQLWEEIHNAMQLEARRRPAAETAKPAKTGKTAAEIEEEEEEAFLASLEANPDVDPAYKKFLRRLKTKAEGKDIREKVAKIDAFEAREVAREERQFEENVDTAFANFAAKSKKHEALVGTLPFRELTDPGHKGWRLEIYKVAKIVKGDSLRVMEAKMERAKEARLKDKLEEPETHEEEPNAYEAAAKKNGRPPQPREPGTQRFTTEDFEGGTVVRPKARRVSTDGMNGPEVIRTALREAGDPRGERGSSLDPDDTSDLPG